LRGFERQTLRVDGGGPLGALDHEMQIAIPDLGDAPATVALNTSAFLDGIRVKGRMISVVFRVRDGRSKRPGRVLVVKVSFTGNSTLSGGDQISLVVGWDALYMGEIPFRTTGASTPPSQPAGAPTVTNRVSAWARAERTLLADKTRLGKVVRELEIPVPDLSGSVEAETVDFVFSSRVLRQGERGE